MDPRLIVSGDAASAEALAVVAAATLRACPVAFAGGSGAVSVRGSATSTSLGALGALTLLASPASSVGAPSEGELRQLEWISWCARELFPAAAAAAAAAADVLSACAAKLDAALASAGAADLGGPVALAACASAFIVAAARGVSPAPLPASVAALVARMQKDDAFVQAAAILGKPDASLLPAPARPSASAAAATGGAAGGGKGGKRKGGPGEEGTSGGGAGAGAGAAAGTGAGAAAGGAKGKGGGAGGGGGGGGAGGAGAAAAAAAAAATAAAMTYMTAAPVSPDDAALMKAPVLHTLTAVFTAAAHAAFPAAASLGFDRADVALNSVPGMLHHYQCNAALSLFQRLKAGAGGGAGGPGGAGEKKKEAKAAKTKDGQTAPDAAAAGASAGAAAPAATASGAVAAAASAGAAAAAAVAAGPAASSPRAVADALIAAVHASGPHAVIGRLEASGPGYINIYLPFNFVAARLASVLLHGVRAGPMPGDRPRRVVVDYSSPNIAKDMHIGHLRSTIIGDAIARLLEFAGHSVVRLNHAGDWGTQFGMLIAHLKDLLASGAVKDADLDASISDLTGFYKAAKRRFDQEPAFAAVAHSEVVALQSGDAANLALWRRMVAVSSAMFGQVYTRLGVDPRLELRGESYYNPLLPAVLADLQSKGLLKEEPGPNGVALVQWVAGQEVPLMVRKSDGGFGYDSTDLAALKHRVEVEKADWLIYVVDSGQSLHFDLVFGGARAAGWYDPAVVRVEHTGFGVVLGEDGKKFKTRDGGVVRLTDVLDEARSRASAVIAERMASGSTPITAGEAEHAASVLGYGGVKYFDLRQNRLTDYTFSYERMLSPDGDTAVYLEYSHARIASILRRAKETFNIAVQEDLVGPLASAAPEAVLAAFAALAHPSDLALALDLLRFQDVLNIFQSDLMAHRLCEYTYFLAGKFSDFFRDCPVLAAEGVPPALRAARLLLVSAAQRTMATAMTLLGIEPLDRI